MSFAPRLRRVVSVCVMAAVAASCSPDCDASGCLSRVRIAVVGAPSGGSTVKVCAFGQCEDRPIAAGQDSVELTADNSAPDTVTLTPSGGKRSEFKVTAENSSSMRTPCGSTCRSVDLTYDWVTQSFR